jgi:S-adenosylmethionine:tRNA ribosyltransferase-isomerase
MLGSTPLPPYLKRPAEALDAERYQTIYAREEGSVAAPTAGLHFTPWVFDSLARRNISRLYITLHVGAGTFLPVKSDRLRDHLMHEEFIEVNLDTVQILLEKLSGYITAVGTTTLRTVESLYWLGIKTTQNKYIAASELSITQWDPYQTDPGISVKDSLRSLQEWISRQPDKKLITRTQLFIVPGYQFKIIRGLITNFHQPQSTLLLLVGALIGKDWKKVYQFALENDYRFLSYGDGCMFLTD